MEPHRGAPERHVSHVDLSTRGRPIRLGRLESAVRGPARAPVVGGRFTEPKPIHGARIVHAAARRRPGQNAALVQDHLPSVSRARGHEEMRPMIVGPPTPAPSALPRPRCFGARDEVDEPAVISPGVVFQLAPFHLRDPLRAGLCVVERLNGARRRFAHDGSIGEPGSNVDLVRPTSVRVPTGPGLSRAERPGTAVFSTARRRPCHRRTKSGRHRLRGPASCRLRGLRPGRRAAERDC